MTWALKRFDPDSQTFSSLRQFRRGRNPALKPDFPQRLMKNWAVKILSLAAAILIYFLTGISELEESYITVQLDYSVPEGYALFSGSASRVPVTLRGDSDGLWDISEA